MKTNRAISSLLAFCMLIGMVTLLPLTAHAEDMRVQINGDKPDGYYTVSGNEVVSVTSPSDNYMHIQGSTITLRNFNYNSPDRYGINIEGDCTIVKEGSSKLRGANGDDDSSRGIYCNGALTFRGSGDLTVVAGESNNASSIGVGAGSIIVSEGTLICTDDVTTGWYNSSRNGCSFAPTKTG